jgi:hypothetical protein
MELSCLDPAMENPVPNGIGEGHESIVVGGTVSIVAEGVSEVFGKTPGNRFYIEAVAARSLVLSIFVAFLFFRHSCLLCGF